MQMNAIYICMKDVTVAFILSIRITYFNGFLKNILFHTLLRSNPVVYVLSTQNAGLFSTILEIIVQLL
jgi:hypothetical protein